MEDRAQKCLDLFLILDIQGGMSRNNGPGLYEFLMEAELQQYYPGIRGIYFHLFWLYFFYNKIKHPRTYTRMHARAYPRTHTMLTY